MRAFIYINTILIPYHAAVVFAMAMSMAQAQTKHEVVANLYWVVPVNLLLASIPNLLILLIYLMQKKKMNLVNAFLKAEVYVILLQILLHGGLLILSEFGSNI